MIVPVGSMPPSSSAVSFRTGGDESLSVILVGRASW